MKTQTIRLMGTTIELAIDKETPNQVLSEAVDLLRVYEQRFSANDTNSELMKVNHQAGKRAVSVHPDLYQLIKLGKKHSCAPNSRLNIAIGPLVQNWRIGFSDARVPSPQEICHLLKQTDPRRIHLDDASCSVYLEEPGMLIDLGALAKGYIADKLLLFFQQQGVRTALLNLGGNVVVFGPSPHEDHQWRIGIQDPFRKRNQPLLAVKVQNQSVVTSGIYERSLKKEDQIYHHILDPQTGYPMESEIASLTILSQHSVDGEIWTTRLFGKNVETILSELSTEGIEGIIITTSGEVFATPAVSQQLIDLG